LFHVYIVLACRVPFYYVFYMSAEMQMMGVEGKKVYSDPEETHATGELLLQALVPAFVHNRTMRF
jgi:hypothetical protein